MKKEADQKFDSIDNMHILSSIGLNSLGEKFMYDLLLESFDTYLLADSLFRKNEKSGIDESANINAISQSLINMRIFFVNGGTYYHEKEDYKKAFKYFGIYNLYPHLTIFDCGRTNLPTETYDEHIKWYAILSAIYAKEHSDAIKLLNKAITDYSFNDEYPYKESDLYEHIANEYHCSGDYQRYIEVLKVGVDKFPDNQFFIGNLLNEYVKNNQYSLVNTAVEKYPVLQTCEMLSAIAVMFSHKEKKAYTHAEEYYKKALKQDEKCVKALMGLGVLYSLKAQGFTEKKPNKPNKEAISSYKKSIDYLEESYKEAIDGQDKITILDYLHKVYYDAGMQGMDTAEDFDRINKLRNQMLYDK